jgi:iron-sulfur cluster repair protein YtfE (RIC family)
VEQRVGNGPHGRLPMEGVMQALRDEHAELAPKIERLRVLADGLTSSSATLTIKPRLDEALEFLQEHLTPHAMAEEAVLYPAVEEAMGAPGATATMARDHVGVMALTEAMAELRAGIRASGPSTAQILEARRLLYGLYALVGLHFAKEEEVYVPILEAKLDAAGAAALYARMEEAAAKAREVEEAEQVVVVAG